jgi:hypothetical protein
MGGSFYALTRNQRTVRANPLSWRTGSRWVSVAVSMLAGISTPGHIWTLFDPVSDAYAVCPFSFLCPRCRLFCAERTYTRSDAGLCDSGIGCAASIRPRAWLVPRPPPWGTASRRRALSPPSLLRQCGDACRLHPGSRPVLCGSAGTQICGCLHHSSLPTRPPAPLRARTSARLSLTLVAAGLFARQRPSFQWQPMP